MNFINMKNSNRLIVVQYQNTRLLKAFEVDKRTPWTVKVKFFDPHGSEKNQFESVLKTWFETFKPVNIAIDQRTERTLDIVTKRDVLTNSPKGTKSYDSGYCGIYIMWYLASVICNTQSKLVPIKKHFQKLPITALSTFEYLSQENHIHEIHVGREVSCLQFVSWYLYIDHLSISKNDK